MDRKLIGKAVEREMRRNRAIGSWPALDRATGVSRATLYRLRDGDPKITAGTFARVEAGLGMTTDTLLAIGLHDLEELADLGASSELVSWVRKEIEKSAGQSPHVSRSV